jgi:hypothetical protein
VGVRLAEEVGDVDRILLPFGVGSLLARLVTRLRRPDEIDRDRKVAGPADVTAAVAADRIVPLGPHTAFGSIAIERIETPHANIGHYSYIVTWHGRRLYFSGDTESTDSLAAAKRLDAAFISPWIYQSIIKKGIRIDAKRVVIYHHQSGERVPGCDTGCSVPRQGSTIRFE